MPIFPIPPHCDRFAMVVDDDVDLVLAAIGDSPVGRMVSAINVVSPEIGREAPATVCAPLVVSLPWRTARCPIVDPDLTPEWSDIPVLVAASVLTVRRPLRFLGFSNSLLGLRRIRGRDQFRAGSRKHRIGDAGHRSGAVAKSKAPIAGRTFATQTMRGLRRLTETQSPPSVRVSPTQDGLSALVL